MTNNDNKDKNTDEIEAERDEAADADDHRSATATADERPLADALADEEPADHLGGNNRVDHSLLKT